MQIKSSQAIDSLAASFRECALKFGNGDSAEEFRLSSMQLIDQPQDHCFAKCLWTESHQYNEATNSIDVSKLISQLAGNGFQVPQHLIDLSEPTDGSCKALFDKTRTFVQRELSNYEE